MSLYCQGLKGIGTLARSDGIYMDLATLSYHFRCGQHVYVPAFCVIHGERSDA